jgi:ribonuclease G
MSHKQILFNSTPTEKRVALLEDGKLIEVIVEQPDQFRLVGNIYRGRVVSILPGITAAGWYPSCPVSSRPSST